jgi:PLP dependent protein
VITPERVVERLELVRERIARAGGVDVEVIAVTKGFGPEAVHAALAAGLHRVGENYAQELLAKREALSLAEVHFIGRMQSNKVRSLVEVVDVFESVDRRSLIEELARRIPGATVLIQVNSTGEPDKGGCAPDHVADLVGLAGDAGLHVDGLMTVGPTHGGPGAARPGFRVVRRLVDDLGLRQCSMGMSDDLEVAVAEGSTRIRVGTGLFGERPRAGRT